MIKKSLGNCFNIIGTYPPNPRCGERPGEGSYFVLRQLLRLFFCAVILGQSACRNDKTIVHPPTNAQPVSTQTPLPNPTKKELDRWDIADRETVRLQPSAFSQLPENIVVELQARQCAIPQIHSDPKPHNVISGEFQKRGQTDWAVLCSKDLISSILIFWSGSVQNPSTLERMSDKYALKGIGNDNIGYCRYIDAVGKAFIEEHYRAYGGPQPPEIDHEGIANGIAGKGSIVHYYHNGKWLQLSGAD